MAKKKGNILTYAVNNPKESLLGTVLFAGAGYIIYKAIKNSRAESYKVSEKNPYNWSKYITRIDAELKRKKISYKQLALYSQKEYEELAKALYDAEGITDDYGQTKAVYQKISNKYSFALLCRAFELKYGKDLREWLKSGYYYNPAGGYSETQIEELNNIVESLPEYIKLK